MTKRTGPIGSAKPITPSAVTAPAVAASAVEASPSQEKTPEEKAAIAAVSQPAPGAAEPFGVATPADVAKNVVTDALVAAAAAAGDPLASQVGDRAVEPAATVPAAGTAVDGSGRVAGELDVADRLGGAIPRGPGIAAAAERMPSRLSEAPTIDAAANRLADAGSDEDTAVLFDPLGDLAGRTFMVRSASDRGRRRGGISFGPTATPVDVDELTPENLGLILSDKQLFAELLPRED